jgi:hypothetical protein
MNVQNKFFWTLLYEFSNVTFKLNEKIFNFDTIENMFKIIYKNTIFYQENINDTYMTYINSLPDYNIINNTLKIQQYKQIDNKIIDENKNIAKIRYNDDFLTYCDIPYIYTNSTIKLKKCIYLHA